MNKNKEKNMRNTVSNKMKSQLGDHKSNFSLSSIDKFKILKEIRSLSNQGSNVVSKVTTKETSVLNKLDSVSQSPESGQRSPILETKFDNQMKVIRDGGYHAFEGTKSKASPLSQEKLDEIFLQRKKEIFDRLRETDSQKNVSQTLYI